MGYTRKPAKDAPDGDVVTTPATEPAEDVAEDLQALLEQAEAEAAEADAAAAAARARVREIRGDADEPVRRPWWAFVAKIVAVIVVVGSLAGSGWIVWQHHKASERRQQAAEFIATADEGVVAMTSLDFNTVRDQVRQIIDNSTGSFREDLVTRSDQIIKVAETSKAVAKGTVREAAVESMNSDEAVVLVVGSEEISNAAGNQQPRSFRFRVTVTRESDQLKMSKLELVL